VGFREKEHAFSVGSARRPVHKPSVRSVAEERSAGSAI
jgi:hypothetical protein